MGRTKYLYDKDDVMEILGCSQDHAYKVIRKLNDELKKQGYEVESGKVPKPFFATKYFGFTEAVEV